MNSFFKYVLATIVGIIVAFFLIIFISLGIIGGLVHSIGSDESVIVADNSILTISIPYAIDERTNEGILSNIGFAGIDNDRIGLNDILTRIEVAKTDDKIKGIYLDLGSVAGSFATLEEIRNALEDFKTSKKFVIAYSEYYSQSSYYLASTADKIYLYPEGLLEFTGLSSQSIFFKGALDKLGIEAQVIKVGTYKSAVEPYILDKMSPANREQVTSFLE